MTLIEDTRHIVIVNSPAGGETAADNSETEWTILDYDDCIVFMVASNHAMALHW